MTAETVADVVVLLELLSSRICHDLVSPVGAIGNGIEFMEESGDDPVLLKQAGALIAHSALSASSRLQVFRLAYGAGGRDGNVKPEDIQKAFGTLIRTDGKIRQSWDPFGPLGINPTARGYCKVLMATLMLAQDCLPRGGTIFVDPGQEGETLVKAESPDRTVREGVEAALAATLDPEDLDPRLVHPYILGLLGRAYGFSIAASAITEGAVIWSIRKD